MRRLITAIAVVLLSCTAAGAQEAPSRPLKLTLAQAVERARVDGFDVRMARADARIAAADAASAGAALRPQIGIAGTLLDANEPQLGMPVARQAYGAATLSIPLWAPASRLNERVAQQTARSAQTAVAATTNDTVFAVVQAYRKAQLADAVVGARRTAVQDQATHLQLTEERVAAGKVARYVTLRDRAALAAAQQALEDAQSERDQAAYELVALLDLTADAVAVEPLAPVAINDTRQSVLARALTQRPSLLAAQQRVESAQGAVAAARAQYRPSAVLTAQTYNGASSPALGQSGGQIQVSASVPVIDGGSRAAALAKAQAQYDRVLIARDQVHAAVVRDVASAWREYDAATRNLQTATAVQSDAAEQLRLATLRQIAGKAIEVEVLDALSVAASARETVLRSIARYDIAVAAIHHAAGDASP